MSATLTLEAPREHKVAVPLITLGRVEKIYRTGKLEYPALRGVDLTIGDGEMVAVVGPSGSGKTTILKMITGIDRPTRGSVNVDGRQIDGLSEEQLAIWRGRNVGIVFSVLPVAADLDGARERDAAARLRPQGLEARAPRNRETQSRTGRAGRQAPPSAR